MELRLDPHIFLKIIDLCALMLYNRYRVIMGEAMSLFFNPFSKHSGITHIVGSKNKLAGSQEISDRTIWENIIFQIEKAKSNVGLDGGYAFAMLEVIIGSHYESFDVSDEECAKGILDLLIFPLIARKLLIDSFRFLEDENSYQFKEDENSDQFKELIHCLYNGLGWAMLVPSLVFGFCLELARVALALVLGATLVTMTSIILTPFVVMYGIGVGVGEIGKAFQNCHEDHAINRPC